MKHIRKVKWNDGEGRLLIVYEEDREGGQRDEVRLNACSRPGGEFFAALQALAEDVAALCELPEEQVKLITVTGVSWSETDAGVVGATLIARKALQTAHSPLNLVTPHKFEEDPSGQDNPDSLQVLPQDTRGRLDALAEVVAAYLDGGCREQGSLFAPEVVAMARRMDEQAKADGVSVTVSAGGQVAHYGVGT